MARLRLWDAATGRPRSERLPAAGPVMVVAFSPDGKTLVTGTRNGYLEIRDATTGAARGPAQRRRGRVRAITFSPDGALIASGGAVILDAPRASGGRSSVARCSYRKRRPAAPWAARCGTRRRSLRSRSVPTAGSS